MSLVQELTGVTRADTAKQVLLGEALAAGVGAGAGSGDEDVLGVATPGAGGPRAGGLGNPDGTGVSGVSGAVPTRPWHACLGDALLAGAITSAQHDVILRGLGEPPTPTVPAGTNGTAGDDASGTDTDGVHGAGDDDGAVAADLAAVAAAAEFAQVWALAATELVAEAATSHGGGTRPHRPHRP